MNAWDMTCTEMTDQITHMKVLIAAKKDLELQDIKCSKDLELISGTVNISKQKKMVISSYYRPPNQTDESYLNKA